MAESNEHLDRTGLRGDEKKATVVIDMMIGFELPEEQKRRPALALRSSGKQSQAGHTSKGNGGNVLGTQDPLT
jgi:hypothetical protein